MLGRVARQPNDPLAEAVLLVPSTSAPSGVVTYVLGEVAALGPVRCAVVAEPGSALAGALPPGCACVSTRPGALGLTLALMRHQSRFRFVQAHGPRALLAARLAGIRSRRLGYVFHEVDGARARYELLLARGVRVAGNGRATADWAELRLTTEVATLPPTVNTVDALPKADARTRLNLSPDDLIIGVVGRLSRVKWPLLAVEAVARMGFPATLVFVGDGPEREAIFSAARNLGVRVHLPGSIVQASRLMTAFDVIVSCSPQESFGLSAAEAMVSGVPVVAVDSPGLRLLTNNGRLQRLVAPTPDDLAAELTTTVAGNSPPRELREYVLHEFGLDASTARLDQYFRQWLVGAT
jgi:glycosyltransferase involved in cell wall biosynthesis